MWCKAAFKAGGKRERKKKHTQRGGGGMGEEVEEGGRRGGEMEKKLEEVDTCICVHTHTNILHHTACEHRLYKKYTVWVLSSLGI